MKRVITLILAVMLTVSFGTSTVVGARALAPHKIIITLEGWLEPAPGLDIELAAGGWIKKGDKVIDFNYMNFGGTELQASREAMPRLKALVNQKCFRGTLCEIHGYSRGSDVLVWIENQVGWPKPGLDIYLHNPGAGDTGAARSPFLTDRLWSQVYNPLKWIFGTPNLNAPLPTKGTQIYYNNADAFANLTPLCKNLGQAISMGIQLPIWHSIVLPKNANYHVWYGPTGDVNHEYGNAYPSGATVKSCLPLAVR